MSIDTYMSHKETAQLISHRTLAMYNCNRPVPLYNKVS